MVQTYRPAAAFDNSLDKNMKKCLSLLLAVAAFATGFTLCSCGGGGGGGAAGANSSFAVTTKQFTNGSKSFYILANNLWTLRSTGSADGLIQSDPDNYTGTATCWGEITTGSFDKKNAGHAVVLFRYHYDAKKNEGILEWSWDSADANNEATPSLAYITTIHNLPGGGGDDEEGGKDEMGGVGEELDPLALAEHYRQARVEFNFNTGMCVLSCGCGAYSQNIHFEVRTGN